ncbi:MAG: sensor histidine kinase [Flavobacteriaceae bacterium]|nr:sensor histidine kinase [Flavobacteriaceae bacterium]
MNKKHFSINKNRLVFYLLSLFMVIHLSCKKERKTPFLKIKKEDIKIMDSIMIASSMKRYNKNKQYDSIIIAIKHLNSFMKTRPYLKNASNMTFYVIGEAYRKLDKLDSAAVYFKKAIVFFEIEPNAIDEFTWDYVDTVYGIIAIDRKTGNYDKAIKTLYKALVNLNGKRPDLRSRLYYYLGYTYWYSKNFDKAEEMFRKALQIPQKTEYIKHASYTGLGDVFLSKNKLDSSLYYFEKTTPYYKGRESKSNFHNNELNKAEVFIKKKEATKAKKLILEAKSYYLKNDNFYNMGRIYLLLAEIAFINKENDSILSYLEKANPFIEKNGSYISKEQLYYNFSRYYKEINKPTLKKKYDIKLNKIISSLDDLKKRSLVDVYELKHLNELNEFKIRTQEEHLQLKEKQNRWLISGLLFLFLLMVLLFILYKKWSKTQKKLTSEKVNTLIESQKVKTIQSHLDGQNNERKRIAKDLHDSISGNLAAIKVKLTNIESDSENIKTIISNIDDTYNEVRQISHNLLPKETELQSFTQRLDNLINLYKTKKLHIEFDVFPIEEINNMHITIQVEIYKILQELITNITKHAKASEAVINITAHESFLNILVEDNGTGFNKNKISSGIGLQNISSRVTTLKGALEIDSSKGKGTTITINIPKQNNGEKD